LEIPAGKLNPGESHYECGLRELLEEIGAAPIDYSYMGAVYPTPAYDTEVIHLYLAKGLIFTVQSLDEDEFLDIEKLPFKTAVRMVLNDSLKDAKTQIALLKAAYRSQ
ncbi:MAG: NUDIX hydrolase, partial [Oscillospiraceae bacterium]|nr:NUDIX hydrolase [Oscillospiraceae bacterium]